MPVEGAVIHAESSPAAGLYLYAASGALINSSGAVSGFDAFFEPIAKRPIDGTIVGLKAGGGPFSHTVLEFSADVDYIGTGGVLAPPTADVWNPDALTFVGSNLYVSYHGSGSTAGECALVVRDAVTLSVLSSRLNYNAGIASGPGTLCTADAISPDGTTFYFLNTGSGVADQNIVYSCPVIGGSPSAFASYGSWSTPTGDSLVQIRVTESGLVVGLYNHVTAGTLDSARVVVWNASGTHLIDFAVPVVTVGAIQQQTRKMCIDNADTGIWTGGTCQPSSPFGTYLNHYRLSDGALLNTVVAGPNVIGNLVAFGAPVVVTPSTDPPQAPPKIPLVKCAPQSIISSPTPNAGCSKGGTGWRRTYYGPSGTVPIGADPVDGETMTGKTAAHLWIEITHTSY